MFGLLAAGRFKGAIDKITDWSRSTTSLLLPPSCAFCEQPLESDLLVPQLCADCELQFTPGEPSCLECGHVFRSSKARLKVKTPCPECTRRKFAFDRVFSLGVYEGALAEAVLRMKYEGGQSLAYALGRHLAKCVYGNDRGGCFDLVACATKHWTKRLFTGINSPEVIMHGLAERANLAHVAALLVCRRRISKQSMLSPTRRQQNVKQAWFVSRKHNVEGARVLLVDDILTTGATAHAMATVLKQSGAKQVSVAVVGAGDEIALHN